MTDKELMDLRDRVDAAVTAEMERQMTAARLAVVGKELDTVVRELARSCVAARRDAIKARIEAWLEANVDRAVELIAKQSLDEALGEVRRRVLGR